MVTCESMVGKFQKIIDGPVGLALAGMVMITGVVKFRTIVYSNCDEHMRILWPVNSRKKVDEVNYLVSTSQICSLTAAISCDAAWGSCAAVNERQGLTRCYQVLAYTSLFGAIVSSEILLRNQEFMNNSIGKCIFQNAEKLENARRRERELCREAWCLQTEISRLTIARARDNEQFQNSMLRVIEEKRVLRERLDRNYSDILLDLTQYEFIAPSDARAGQYVTIQVPSGERVRTRLPNDVQPGQMVRIQSPKQMEFSKEEIQDIMNGIFSVKEEIDDGRYLKLNNKLKTMHDTL